MGYFSDLVKSFSPGGQTPLQALFGVPENVDSLEDYMLFTNEYDAQYPSQWAAILGDEEARQQIASKFDSSGSDVTPSSPDPLSDGSYYEDLVERIKQAADDQNTAAQNSADKAMEFTEEQNRLDREFQAEQAQKAMDYQTQMSNTAYQRAMEDMRKAGLNPKLVGQLSGASTPSGVAASGTGGGSGVSASMSMQNTSAIAGVLESYISSAASLDNKDKDLLSDSLSGLISILGLALKYGV